jgi:hypothetical protein
LGKGRRLGRTKELGEALFDLLGYYLSDESASSPGSLDELAQKVIMGHDGQYERR